MTAGDIGFRYVLQVLEDGGESRVVYRMNHNADRPGYGFQISNGTTSLTESWQSLKNVSNDHMMLGHLMEWFYSGLGGISQPKDGAGYKKIKIAPQFVEGINWVKCSYQSINGQVKIEWHRTGHNIIQLKVEISANTKAVVLLPTDTVNVFSEDNEKIAVTYHPQRNLNGDQQTKAFIGSGAYLFQFRKNNMKNKRQ